MCGTAMPKHGYRNFVATKLTDADMRRVEFAAAMTGQGLGAVVRAACRAYLDAAGIPEAVTVSTAAKPSLEPASYA